VFTRLFVRPIPPARALASGGTTGPARFLSIGAVWTFAAVLTVGGCSGMPFGGGDDGQSTTQDGGSSDGATGDDAATTDDTNADNAGADGEASDTGGGTDDACALLTTEEVAAALGKQVNDGKADGSGPDPQCTWEEDTSGVPTILTVAIAKSADYGVLKTHIEPNEPVSGAGDEAFFSAGMNTLIMRKGDTVVQFVALGSLPDAAAKLELMKAVAVKAAGRI
jgi:hypothetical protein